MPKPKMKIKVKAKVMPRVTKEEGFSKTSFLTGESKETKLAINKNQAKSKERFDW